MSRSTSQASSAVTTTSHGISRSMSVKTNTKAQNPTSVPVSDIRLFVTNLRLLDLDLQVDWPGITVQTFSAKNADQKQRIGGSEWALFRLFEIWDPNETAQKLQPFFPPLEPLQSLNLRAALYRCLNELKKNGILGRESILRKTMLDECKGDKFYEILSLFSTAVLKKVLAARDGRDRNAAVARKLATASLLSAEEQRSLIPLAIAHKAALVNVLKRKEEKRRRYLEFQNALDSKAEDINRRTRKCKDTQRAKKAQISPKEAEDVKKQLKDNWVGDPRWLEVILHGENVHAEDAFLNSRFEKIWSTVESGGKLESVESEVGLLENLQSRIQEQEARLQKWTAFYDELKREKKERKEPPLTLAAPTKEFEFDDHLQHQLPMSKQKADDATIQRPALREEYLDILSDMDAELSRVSSMKFNHTSTSPNRRRTSSSTPRSPTWSRKTSRSNSIPKLPKSPIITTKLHFQIRKPSLTDIPLMPPPRHTPAAGTPVDSETTLIGHPSTVRSAFPSSHAVASSETQNEYRPELEPTPPTSDPAVEPSSPSPVLHNTLRSEQCSLSPASSPEDNTYYPSKPPVFDPPELNAEEVLADQIITSIGNATPSPVKKTQSRMSLSLVERTRMSMARTTSFEPLPEFPELPLPPLPSPPPLNPECNPQTTLLERTRLSMVTMSNRPRQSLAAREKVDRRKSRNSLFPVNQFDTPRTRKSFEAIEEVKSIERTPKEELFSDEVDYDRVFKSRPRIATSPVFSPPPGEREEGYSDGERDGGDGGHRDWADGDGECDGEVTGIDLRDVDQDDDEDGFTKTWADSPSRRKVVKSAR